jgi:hypothetical protein
MRTAIVAPMLVALTALAGCGSSTEGQPQADHSCADTFVPLVTFETAGDGSADSAQVFDQQRELLESQLGATDVASEFGTRCGYPARTISYTAPEMGDVPERRAKVLCVLADVNGTAYLTTVTVSSVDADEPTYAGNSETILSGFQVNATA